jgi:hypothetical protein
MGSFAEIAEPVNQEALAPLDDFMRRCALNFRDHRTVLNELARQAGT